mgnify:CR=1 FL=1|tara:strand:+ start:365 stop:589 length:225 start_codon:yes stop_codon:yes gene_type:complete
MEYFFKKIFLNFTFNIFLFISLLIGIQNNSNKARVNLIIDETIDLPVSFIIGASFISGSILGSLLPLNFSKQKS